MSTSYDTAAYDEPVCCETQAALGDGSRYSHDGDCVNYDGAPVHQWEVTTPAEVYATDDQPDEFPEPDEFEESRPIDLDDCSLCRGDGCYEVRDWMGDGGLIDVTCPSCGGNGERGAA